MSVRKAHGLVSAAESNLKDLLSGADAAVYRNDPVFMLSLELLERAGDILDQFQLTVDS
jgi:hypothetical protein